MSRVYSVIHPTTVSVPLTFATGIVIPLMGFWNAVIYITTSWAAVRMLFSGRLNANGSVKRNSPLIQRPSIGSRQRTGSESESVKGLAVGRGSGYNEV